jgi:hypothetical protein
MDYDKRLDLLIAQIRDVKDKRAQRDLLLMSRNIEKILTDLDRERVQCRRLQKDTPRYRELHTQTAELLVNLEHHLTFARLMYG